MDLYEIAEFFSDKPDGVYTKGESPIPGVHFHKSRHLVKGNYSEIEVWEGIGWTPDVMQWRGHVVYTEGAYYGTYAAQPFDKFFNYGEETADARYVNKLMDACASMWKLEKVNGTLIIFFYDQIDKRWKASTRGRLTSYLPEKYTDFITIAEKIGKSFSNHLNVNNTYLFELVTPEEDHITDYGDTEELVWIGMREENGNDQLITDFVHGAFARRMGVRIAKNERITDINVDELTGYSDGCASEGFVVAFVDPHGYIMDRVKIKTDQYRALRQFRDKSGNHNYLLKTLQREDGFERLFLFVAECPDKWRPKVAKWFGEILIKMGSALEHYSLYHDTSRKEYALLCQNRDWSGLAFMLLDGKNLKTSFDK